MEAADKSLVILSVLGIITAIYWSIYVFYPTNVIIERLGVADEVDWIIAYILVVLTVLAGGVHVHHRRNS